MRALTHITALPALLLLAACQPPPPVGDFPGQRIDAQLSGEVPLQMPSEGLPPYGQPGGIVGGAPLTEAQVLANETRAALGQPPRALPNNPVELVPQGGSAFDAQTSTAAPLPAPLPGSGAGFNLDRDNPSISSEQDFAAVSAQRDIAADAERLRAAREQYRVATPTELQRPDETGPNVFAYALGPARPVGTQGAYGRGLGASEGRAANRCAAYSSIDRAQEDFLSAGGPQRDRLGLDPDGDGNACSWDPADVRDLVQR